MSHVLRYPVLVLCYMYCVTLCLCYVTCIVLPCMCHTPLIFLPPLSWFLEPKSHLLWRLVLNPGCIWGEDSSLQRLRPVCWVHASTLLSNCSCSRLELLPALLLTLLSWAPWSGYMPEANIWYTIWDLGGGYCGSMCLEFCTSSELANINATNS